MATNLALNPKLITEAQKIGGFKTKKDAVNTALLEYIQRHKQLEIVKLFGSVEYDPQFDHKKARNKR